MINNNHKILVVDDDSAILKLITVILEKYGYVMYPFNDPLKALNKIKEVNPDIILLDLMMPNMSGFQLANKIREMEEFNFTPIALITAHYKGIQNIVKGFELGANDFIQKPFDAQELVVRVHSLSRMKVLYDQVKQQNKLVKKVEQASLAALAKLAEFRDNETSEHIHRIKTFTKLISTELAKKEKYSKKFTPSYINEVSTASILHDIGKVGIPDSVLLKPGALTKEEFEEMKTHTTIGYLTLKDAHEMIDDYSFMEIALDIAHSHHEKWDGSGYPRGLAGEDIPLEARIVAVVDVYDALTSKRVYKDAMPHEKAISIIKEGDGKHFDPEIVEIFLKLEREVKIIKENLNSEY